MSPRSADPKKLEKLLDYNFEDRHLLSSALTHASIQAAQRKGRDDNERLEFLGDRVLGLSISALLMKHFPDAREGDLARRYNRLVRRKMCAEVASDLGLGPFLILSAGEERSGGRRKSTILANAMEALLGAIFLDGGYDQADRVIFKLWSSKLLLDGVVQLDAKTALQEWAQGNGYDLPVYETLDRKGPDHEPLFVTEVTVKTVGTGQGEGTSKRAAEQRAAQALLISEKVWDNE